MQYKKQSNSVYFCDYHMVLPTKYRRKIFNEGVFAFLELKLKEISSHYPALEFKEVNHDKDHIHFLVSIPPKMSVGQVVRIIKANTSSSLKKQFKFLKDVYWGTDSIWSEGYFVCTVGLNEDAVQKYIQLQGEEDSGRSQIELM